MKPIRLSGHAREQLDRRGVTEKEIIEAISTVAWEPAEMGRFQCRKDFPYHKEWNRKLCKIKQVRPIFVEEDKEIIVVTVYTYFF